MSLKTPAARARHAFVHRLYASHSRSKVARAAISRVIQSAQPGGRCLNVGAGDSAVSKSIVNIDVYPGAYVSCLASGEALPFKDQSFTCVVSQETFEHVRRPVMAISEVYRVLEDGGLFYCQVPFIIGYHPGPTDYWRFTIEGIQEMVRGCGFRVEEVGITAGPASGAYYILVELVAITCSTAHAKLYLPGKAAAALVLAPLRWLDVILRRSEQAKRIAGGHYVIARKPSFQ